MIAHLVQSTIFAGIIWLAAQLLRGNPARVRHSLWMAASLKFLVPFSLFVGLGSHLVPVHIPPPQLRFVMVETALPAEAALPARVVLPAPHRDWLSLFLWLVWAGGSAGIAIRWWIRWRVAAARLRAAQPRDAFPGISVPVRFADSAAEPAVVGIFRPVLVLPQGIEHRLTAEQLDAVVTHELCHIRHRDNLSASIHMLVEAMFWFHPLVWWIGAQLMAERERACDEEVLQRGRDRVAYAESILRVCRFCVESPLACVSGITGAELKDRIRDILTATGRPRLQPAKKLLLAALAIAALGVPLALGLMRPPHMRAQTAPLVKFDVASVKPSEQQFLMIFPDRTGGRVHWTTSLMMVLGYAYRLEPWRILGPVPGNDHVYAFDATTHSNATDDQVRFMFQSLLMDRFHMTVHRETRETDGYVLTVAKGGLKLPAAREGETPPMPEWFRGDDPAVLEGKIVASIPAAGVGAITGRRITMQEFSQALQRVLKVAVIDQTGLTGKYYIGLEFAREDHPDNVDLPDLASAVQALGLKLERHKGPVELLVVDRIEKNPTEN